MNQTITYDHRADVAVDGDFDLAEVLGIRSKLGRLLDEGQVAIDVDLSGVSFMDCAALNVLLWAHAATGHVGGELRIVKVSDTARRFLDLGAGVKPYPAGALALPA
ncbi:STAS domain-containing protein [Nocardioides sp. SYSU D00038]|uniref:STAS domain-containing protein n=1 Tax=Nocardioides sp. SYSU D00038 TaxID=2812554 RepID=UPI0019676CEF|nr:STAS domain-containing protein [Nocardioides sp. SYSU D00038]